MRTTYWIAKYIEDPLRNEPRNVGVIVQHNSVFAARFIGERDDGVFDARKLGSKFSHPNVYIQWRQYWRTQIDAENIAIALRSSTGNYFIVDGGEIMDAGEDPAEDVCQFLYNLLVGDGPVEAYQWQADEDGNLKLASQIIAALKHLQILADEKQLFIRHPVVRDRPISGQHVTHTPSFSQRNGKLYVFDHLDLSGSRPNATKDRAGLLGYMFSDIRAREQDAVTYSLVRPAGDHPAEAVEYAKKVLGSE